MHIEIDQDIRMMNITIEMVDNMIDNIQESIEPAVIENPKFLCLELWDIISKFSPFVYGAAVISENSLNPWFIEYGLNVNKKKRDGGLFNSNKHRLQFLKWMRNKLQGE